MRNLRRTVLIVLVLLLFVSIVYAQESCPAIIEQALVLTDESCTGTERNQVCYGHGELSAEFSAETSVAFAQSGDIAGVERLQKLVISPMDVDLASWGVALFKLRANLPETLPGQNVAVLVFGDVEIEPEPTEVATLVEMTANTAANVRNRPTTEGGVLQALTRDQVVTANGRLADGSWIRIQLPGDASHVGWVSGSLLVGDSAALDVVTPAEELYGPMQAFYFKSGIGTAACAEVPESGILIQTPEGAGRVDLRINEVNINLGSTAYLQAQPGAFMSISMLEGSAQIRVGNITVTIPAGTRVQVPLSADLRPSGAPGPVEAYDAAAFTVLPIRLLERVITIAPPLRQTNPQPTATSTPDNPGSDDSTPVTNTGSTDGTTAGVTSSAPVNTGCSVDAETSINMTVSNNSSETISVYWISYDCQEILYQTLAPGESYVQGTFATHPWVIRAGTGGAILGGPYASDGGSFSITVSG